MSKAKLIGIDNLGQSTLDESENFSLFCKAVIRLTAKSIKCIEDMPIDRFKLEVHRCCSDMGIIMFHLATNGVFFTKDLVHILKNVDGYKNIYCDELSDEETNAFVAVRNAIDWIPVSSCSKFFIENIPSNDTSISFKDMNLIDFADGRLTICTVDITPVRLKDSSKTKPKVEEDSCKEVKSNLRPVKYALKAEKEKTRDGWFHKWVTYSDSDGCEELALVETTDGEMIETYTTKIKFLDRK